MAPLVLSLAQSESKARFFERLGLDPTDRVHKRVYALMKLEAAAARKRLLEGQSLSTAQIHEAAWQREVLRIYEDACMETKAVYRFGHDVENRIEPDNWIIRWLLWQYRDYRNKGRSPIATECSNASSSYGDDDPDADADATIAAAGDDDDEDERREMCPENLRPIARESTAQSRKGSTVASADGSEFGKSKQSSKAKSDRSLSSQRHIAVLGPNPRAMAKSRDD